MGTESSVQSLQTLSSASGGTNVARALFRYVDGANNDKRASAVAVRTGELATVFVAVAPTAQFATELPTLTQILDSFRFAAPSQPGSTAQIRYVPWVDPFEGTWSMEVPAGWQSTGGLLRRGDGVRAVWQLTAPGGAALIFGGDANVPSFFVFPNATSLSLGFREGEPTGPNGPIMLRFQEAAAIGPGIFQQHFGQAQVITVRDRPRPDRDTAAQSVTPGQPSPNERSRDRVPVRRWSSRRNGVDDVRRGSRKPRWHLACGQHPRIRGTGRPVGEAGAALAHVFATSRENAEWRRGEASFQAGLAAQWQEYLNFSNNLQRQTIEDRWASAAAINRQQRDVLGGTVRLVDPQTGETFEASGQSRYYFRVVGQGGAIGTDVDSNPAPNLDLRRLLQVGVDVPDR